MNEQKLVDFTDYSKFSFDGLTTIYYQLEKKQDSLKRQYLFYVLNPQTCTDKQFLSVIENLEIVKTIVKNIRQELEIRICKNLPDQYWAQYIQL